MKNWLSYINKQKSEYRHTQLPTEHRVDMVVVIPCYNEPDVMTTLQSLLRSASPEISCMVAVIINSGEHAGQHAVEQNRKTMSEIQQFSEQHSRKEMQIVPLLFENLPKKHAGVGLARKIGMDLAVEYFYQMQNERGIIVSLDADCTVSDNFLANIHRAFKHNDKQNATIHNFLHRAENNDPTIEKAVRQYETHIRTFSNRLKEIGFPSYYHTIGSAFAVSADAYVRAGGMGRQQAGEDFYFLQKVFALGNVTLLEDVFVYPMARFSDRVPFGTGPALQKIIDEQHNSLKTYSTQSFEELKRFFDRKDSFFKTEKSTIQSSIIDLHPALHLFIEDNHILEAIEDCNRNCATIQSFQKRFFHHFNAFMIIKFLNFVHPNHFEKEPIVEIT